MTAPTWSELKADGRVVFDYPGRKLAIYANQSGQVMLLYVDEGKATYAEVHPDESAALVAALGQATGEAQAIASAMDADYATHVAIEKARG